MHVKGVHSQCTIFKKKTLKDCEFTGGNKPIMTMILRSVDDNDNIYTVHNLQTNSNVLDQLDCGKASKFLNGGI